LAQVGQHLRDGELGRPGGHRGRGRRRAWPRAAAASRRHDSPVAIRCPRRTRQRGRV